MMKKEYYRTLIEKYFDETITETEVQELVAWIRSDRQLNNWLLRELEQSDDSMDSIVQSTIFDKIRQQLDRESCSQSRLDNVQSIPTPVKYRSLHRYVRWVAVICLPLFLTFGAYYLIDSSKASVSSLVVKAGRGDRATLVLPDGTNVELNSASQLSYPTDFGAKERRVELSGEAYFKVTPDVKHPFVVQTGGIEVRVVGTAFNVTAYDDRSDITVVLIEGKVGVNVPGADYLLRPNEKIVYNKLTRQAITSHVLSTDYIEWTKGNLYFDNESLDNISKTLSKIYNVTIRFESEALKQEHFTGTIGGGGIQNALEILMLTSRFMYEVKDSVIVLKEK